MYYSLKSDCYFKKYDEIGYIARPIITMEEVVDRVGALFLEKLSYTPKSILCIVESLREDFVDVSPEQLQKDVEEFFDDLFSDGFLNRGESIETFIEEGFAYATLKGKLAYANLKPQVEESTAHLLNVYFKDTPHLLTFHIELTSMCNERCIHCYIPHKEKTKEISVDLMMRAIDQCKAQNVMTLVFSGGEPMLHPHFCDFLRYAKDLDFNITVLSNLTLLTPEIVSALKYKHACCVNVSLYSLDPSVHDGITKVAGSCEKTKENILKLIENNVAVQINLPVMKQNKDTFWKVIEWGQEHKCTVNTDYLMMARADRSTDNLENRLSCDDLPRVIEDFMENDIVVKTNLARYRENGFLSVNTEPDDRVCGVGITALCMVTNGDVYPCAGWQKYVCGNLKTNTLEEIWYDSPQVKYLRGLRKKDFKGCLNCQDKEFCSMCMSRNSNESPNGDLFEISPITCEAAKISHNIIDKYKQTGKL